MNSAAVVTRLSNKSQTHSTSVVATVGGLSALQDSPNDDLQVSDFLKIEPTLETGAEILADVESVIRELASDRKAMDYIRSLASFQVFEQKMCEDEYPLHNVSRDILSLCSQNIPVGLVEEISNNLDFAQEDASNPVPQVGENSYKPMLSWLSERTSRHYLLQYFQKIENLNFEQLDGIRITYKRHETPGLLSLLGRDGPRSKSCPINIATDSCPVFGRQNRRQSSGNVGSPPRGRQFLPEMSPLEGAGGEEFSSPRLDHTITTSGHWNEFLPAVMIILATSILLASSLKKHGAHSVVDKIIRFTRKITSWIVAHWQTK